MLSLQIAPPRILWVGRSFSTAVFVLVGFFGGAHESDGSDSLVQQHAVEGRKLFFNEVLIAGLRFGEILLDGFQNGRSRVSGRIIHTTGYQNLIEKELPS